MCLTLGIPARGSGWWRRVVGLAAWVGMALGVGVGAEPGEEAWPVYTETRWGLKEGLPSDRVTVVAEGEEGEIWVGCPNALVRLDGGGMVTFHAGNTRALWEVSDQVKELVVAGDGTLWVATAHGLIRRRDARFEVVRFPPSGERTGGISKLARRAAGGVWIGTDEGAWWFDGMRAERTGGKHPVFTLMEDERGFLLVSYTGGVSRMKLGTETWEKIFVNGPMNPLCELGGASEVVSDGRGGVLVGVHGAVFRSVEGTRRWERVAGPLRPPEAEPALMPMIRAARVGDKVMVAGEPGCWLSLWREGRRLPLAAGGGANLRHVTCLLGDRRGAWWIGTADQGLVRLAPRLVGGALPAGGSR